MFVCSRRIMLEFEHANLRRLCAYLITLLLFARAQKSAHAHFAAVRDALIAHCSAYV